SSPLGESPHHCDGCGAAHRGAHARAGCGSSEKDRSCAPGARYLVSAAGIPNYGDDYIAAAWLTYFSRRYPGAEVWLDALSPGVAASLLSGANPEARFTDILWELTRLLPEGESYPQMRERIRTWIHGLGTPRLDTALVHLRSARSIHLLGGGYLNSMWPRNLGLIAAAAEYSRAFDIPV